MAKILLIVAIVISAATAVLGFMNKSTLTQVRDDLAATDSKLKSANATLVSTKKDLDTANQNLQAATDDKTKLTSDLTAAQQAQQTAESALADANKTVDEQKTQIADLQKQIDDFTKVPAPGSDSGATVNVAELQNQLQEANAMVSKLQETNQDLQQQVTTLTAKEKQHEEGLMKPGLEGQILAVNPAWNFVVLSMGDKQGVANNAELLIKRGNQYLGKVRVTSVEPSTSIADIVANSLPAGVSVQPGDTVIYQGAGQ